MKRKTHKKNYEERWDKIRDPIRSITNNLDDSDKKFIKVKFNADWNLPLKTLVLYNMIIVVTSIFHEGRKYYPKAFLAEGLPKLVSKLTANINFLSNT